MYSLSSWSHTPHTGHWPLTHVSHPPSSSSSSWCVTRVPSYLSGMLLLFWELLWGVLSLPELYSPRLLFRKNGRHPELGSGSGGRSSLRSGLGVLFGPKILSSWNIKACQRWSSSTDSTYIKDIFLNDLLLPRNGDCPGAELGVEVIISVIKTHSLHCRELFNIQNILTTRIMLNKNYSVTWFYSDVSEY